MAISSHARLLIGCVLLVFIGLCVRVVAVGGSVPGSCRVWFLDVGQGDAELVETGEGKRILIDGGPDRAVLAKLGNLLPPWDRRIDAAILSHSDPDHATGLAAVLSRYHVAVLYESGLRGKSSAAKAVAADPVPRVVVRTGDRFSVGSAGFDVLAPADAVPGSVPDEPNALSVVLRLSCGGGTVLFPGDLPSSREATLPATFLPADVLKVAHHGSVSSTSLAFLAAVHPRFAVVEVGAENSFGHPHRAVLDRLAVVGAAVFRTDRDGDILCTMENGHVFLAPHPLPF